MTASDQLLQPWPGCCRPGARGGRPSRLQHLACRHAAATFIVQQPDYEHTLDAVVRHFRGGRVPVRNAGRRNAEHVAWIYLLNAAREMIAKTQRIAFVTERVGRRVVYRQGAGGAA